MADSTLTKRALASALKELMTEMPFEKINVSHICEKCNMNRKSFYYHFKDKYDLVNWIFDIEFISVLNTDIYNDRWEFFIALADYFYKNRSFYRKALKIKGQNSFSEHFHESLYPLLKMRINALTEVQTSHKFIIDMFADVSVCAFEHWLSEKDCIPPEEFVSIIKTIIQSGAAIVYQETEKN